MEERDFERFAASWRGKPSLQVVEEMASMSVESWREPDHYFFWIKDDKLISPETGLPIEFSIREETDLEKREHKLFLQLQGWACENKGGVAVWISPPHGERSTIIDGQVIMMTKIIVSEIVGEGLEKRVENTAIFPDISAEDCCNVASTLTGRYFDDPEEVRDCLFFLSPEQNSQSDHYWNWIDYLEKAIGSFELFDRIRMDLGREKKEALNKAWKYQRMLEEEVFPADIFREMKRDGFLNKNGGSTCPVVFQNASAAFLAHSRLYAERILNCTCPMCKERVDAIITNGRIYCPKCWKSAPYIC